MDCLFLILSIVCFCSLLSIVLNIYNGDILGINNNIEYSLWYITTLAIIFIYSTFLKINFFNTLIKYPIEIFIFVIGIILNIYWSYAWKLESNDYRHRTEYYDTQVFLCSIFFFIIVRRLDLIKTNNYKTNNYKTKNSNKLHTTQI
tara:strand:- start:1118 stop:1555 length:438 start_codon:yes stop_codon:yes gene_type:complete